MENPIFKWDDLGVPLFSETSINVCPLFQYHMLPTVKWPWRVWLFSSCTACNLSIFFCKNQSSEVGWLWNWSSSNPIYNPCTLPLPSHHLPQDSTPPIWGRFQLIKPPKWKIYPTPSTKPPTPKKPKSPQQKKPEKIYPHSAFISSNSRSLRDFFDSNVQSRWVCGEGSSAPPGRKDWGWHDCHGGWGLWAIQPLVASCWWSMWLIIPWNTRYKGSICIRYNPVTSR